MVRGGEYARKCQLELEPGQTILAARGQSLSSISLLLCIGMIALGQQGLDKGRACRDFVIGFVRFMELLFVSVQHGSRIGSMTFVHSEASQGDLGFRRRLFLPRLVPHRQRFFVRFSGGRKIAAIPENVSQPGQHVTASVMTCARSSYILNAASKS